LRALVESLPDAVIVADARHNIRLFSLAAEKMSGYARDEILGRPIEALIAEADKEKLLAHFESDGPMDRQGVEVCGVRKDLSTYPLEIRRGPLQTNHSGWTVAIARDQTDRVRAERLQQKLAAIVNTTDQAIISVDVEGTVTAWNPGAERLYGFRADEMFGMPILRIYPSASHESVEEMRQRLIAGECIPELDVVHVRKNGEVVDVRMIIASTHQDGRLTGFVTINHDISEQKHAQAALRKSESAMAHAQRIARIGSWEWEPDSDRSEISPEMGDILGAKLPLSFEAYRELVHPDDRGHVEHVLGESISFEQPFNVDYRIRRPADGDERIVHVEGEPWRDPAGSLHLTGTLQDVTEQRLAQHRLEESERKYRQIVETAEEGIWVIDTDTRTTFVNSRMAEMLGYNREEMLGKRLLDFMDPEDQPLVEERLSRQKHEKALHWEKAFLRKDGGRRWTRGTASSIFDGEGNYSGALAMIIDITDEKKAENDREALLQRVESERAWLNTVIERSPVGIILCENVPTPRFRLNPLAAELLGEVYTPEWIPFSPKRFTKIIRQPGGEPFAVHKWLADCIAKGEGVETQEFIIEQASRNPIPVMANSAPILAADGHIIGASGILTDISTLKELERMREEWTAIVAHDLRQPVSVISLRADILAAKCEKLSPDLCEQVEHIHAASEQLNRQIGDLSDVSRIESKRMELRREVIEPNKFLEEVLEREARVVAGHDLRLHRGDSVPAFFADPMRVEQVLTNLLSNAAKYSDPGSPIDIETGAQDGAVRIAISNVGPGVRTDDTKNLFGRFERADHGAKPIPGLGLGLYIVRGIVEAHGGEVSVQSTPGKTTTFAFTLPVAKNDSRIHP
jgi:PAS domain S-box-containing protein